MDFKPLITLLAVVNPLAIVPFFIHYTEGFSPRARRDTVITSAFTALAAAGRVSKLPTTMASVSVMRPLSRGGGSRL